MAEQKQAAIPDVEEKSLNEISAADFLDALNAGGHSVIEVHRWSEKKKVELWVEPENFSGIKVGGLLRGLKEKKKFEIEKPPLTEDFRKVRGAEDYFDSRNAVRDPDFIREVAREVAIQLRGGR